jgi:hypothetical protein
MIFHKKKIIAWWNCSLSPLHSVDFPNEFQPAHKLKKFWAVQCLIFSQFAKSSAPKILLPPTPFSLSFLLSLSIIFWTYDLRVALSKFKLPSKLMFEHIQRKFKGFEFKFHVIFVFIFMNDVDLK